MRRLIALGVIGIVLACSPAEARGIRQRPPQRRPTVNRQVQRPQAGPRRPGLLRQIIAIPGRIIRRII